MRAADSVNDEMDRVVEDIRNGKLDHKASAVIVRAVSTKIANERLCVTISTARKEIPSDSWIRETQPRKLRRVA